MTTTYVSRNKANRIAQIVTLLSSHPEGMSQSEIARRLNVNRSTISRYLPDLPGYLYLDDLDGGKWKLDRTAFEFNIRLNLHEAMAIHLATRLLATRMERQNPHAASALRKLSIALENVAPRISVHLNQSANRIDDPAQRQDPIYLKSIEILTKAWAEFRKVKVCYLSENGDVHEYIFSPYFIEPYAIGQSTYVFGLREPPGAIRTFKIERIASVDFTHDIYRLPDDFDPQVLLADAWGIWFTGEPPIEVIMKFSEKVARRVKETRWHASEIVEDQPDGSLLWKARIAEPKEMLPWIRGWGADVEVIEPIYLREAIIKDVSQLMKIYPLGIGSIHNG